MKEQIIEVARNVTFAQKSIDQMCEEKRVVIVSKWNNRGGRTKKPMTGREFVVYRVQLDSRDDPEDTTLWLAKPESPEVYFGACGLKDVEFL